MSELLLHDKPTTSIEVQSPEVSFPKVRTPIRTKITLPYLTLALIMALGVAYLISQIVFDTLEERFFNQLIESGKLASEWMYREEQRLLASLRLLAQAEGVAEAIQKRDGEQLRKLTFGIVLDNREETVQFLDAQGYLLLSMRHISGGSVEEYEFAKEGDKVFAQWSFVEQVLNLEVDHYGDKYAGFVRDGWGSSFYVSGPIFDPAGKFAGVVLVGKNLGTIVQQIRLETLSQVSLYDFDGSVINSTLPKPIFLEGSMISTVLGKQDEASMSRGLYQRRDIWSANLEYEELLGPWEVREDVDIGVIGTALPKSFIANPTMLTRMRIFLWIGIAFILIIGMGFALARYITRPLHSLVQASTRVAFGDLQVRVQPQSDDEVAVLTESFNRMVQSLNKSKTDLLHAYDSTLEGWSKALELRDKETEGHTMRVTKRTVYLAQYMGIDGEDLVHIQRGALLHDIGKMGIPDSILLKPGPLTDEEWVIMRQHPQLAYDMLFQIEYLRPAIQIPYYHHERWNGSGYPMHLKGEEIPIAARIFAVIDVWDALCSDRPYRRAMDEQSALEYISSQSGVQFDPHVVDTFIEMVNANIYEMA